MKENKGIEIVYTVYNNIQNETAYTGSITGYFDEESLKEIAEVMKQNGGHPVEMMDLPFFTEDWLWDECCEDFCEKMGEDFDPNWDEYSIEIDEKMPMELVKAAEDFIEHKDVQCNFYYMKDGVEMKGICEVALETKYFWKLVEAAKHPESGKNDFDLLKERDPETWLWTGEWFIEDAFKSSMTKYGYDIKPYLKEFPNKVYEYLTY